MRLARFAAGGRVHEGEWRDGVLLGADGRAFDPEAVVWLPPVQPSKVIALALNYAEHAAELGMQSPEEPAVFFKPPSSLVGHRAPVLAPPGARYMHYEVELAVVIGRTCRRVPAARAYDVVRGYTIANDLTVRDYVHNFFRPPVRAKGWDTFCPLGPWLVVDEIEDPHALGLRSYVNGELRQEGHTGQMVWRIPELIEFLSSFMTLEAGDVILTGTPRGISHVRPGDVMRLEVDGVGVLENPVVADGEAP